ncbi:MAG: hypothetical protein B7733_04095 [Myxococcales bacterium FL481]|nr:MAG: hypothetical protein B7733_04095 [Myxococcales bacterium FL481]
MFARDDTRPGQIRPPRPRRFPRTKQVRCGHPPPSVPNCEHLASASRGRGRDGEDNAWSARGLESGDTVRDPLALSDPRPLGVGGVQMSHVSPSVRWVDRQLPVWRTWLVAAVLGGAAAGAIGHSINLIALGTAVTALGLLPMAVGIAAGFTVGWPGDSAESMGLRLGTWLRDRDPHQTAAPVAWAVPLPLVFGFMRALVEYALASFRTPDLVALLVAGTTVATVVAAASAAWLLKRALLRRARARPSGRLRRVVLRNVATSLSAAATYSLLWTAGTAWSVWPRLQFAGVTALWVIAAANAALVAFVVVAVVFDPLRRGPTRPVVDATAIIGIGLIAVGLVAPGANSGATAQLARTPGLGTWLAWARAWTDYDGDQTSSFLGGGDCAPFDEHIHPGAREVPNDGIDQNCSGRDYDGSPFVPDPPGFLEHSSICPRGDCNVVFVTFDSFRGDELAIFGATQEVMPFLESRARTGAAFSNAYSPGPGTMTSVPSMLAGRFDSTLKMDPRIPRRHPVHRDEQLLSDSLHEQGIATHAVFEHRMLDPLGHGWDTFYNPWRPDYASRSTAALQFDQLHRVIRMSATDRFFVYAHILETHHEYISHPEFDRFGDDDRGRYRSELAYVDSLLRELAHLVEREVTVRPTVFIVAGDHGEGFGEHGIAKHNEGLYRAVTWVPLIIWAPNLTRPARLEAPVSLLDIAPTVRNLFGLPPRPDHVGISLLPAIERGQERTGRVVYNQAIYDEQGVYYNLVGMTIGPHRLLHDMRRQTFELYNVATDPDERMERSGLEPQRIETMRAQMYDWLDRIGLRADYVHRPWERERR